MLAGHYLDTEFSKTLWACGFEIKEIKNCKSRKFLRAANWLLPCWQFSFRRKLVPPLGSRYFLGICILSPKWLGKVLRDLNREMGKKGPLALTDAQRKGRWERRVLNDRTCSSRFPSGCPGKDVPGAEGTLGWHQGEELLGTCLLRICFMPSTVLAWYLR